MLCHAEFEDKKEFKTSKAEDILAGICKNIGRNKYFKILDRA